MNTLIFLLHHSYPLLRYRTKYHREKVLALLQGAETDQDRQLIDVYQSLYKQRRNELYY